MRNESVPLRWINLETSSYCNRRCVECIRNSHPDADVAGPWRERNFMPLETIQHVLEQAVEMGHPDWIGLTFYNEPLLDPRIVDIVIYVKSLGLKSCLLSNGDNLTVDLARQLDGMLDVLMVSMYLEGQARKQRRRTIKQSFEHTDVRFKPGIFGPSHYSPTFDLDALVKRNIDRPCLAPIQALHVNHRGEACFCCADFAANFDLGTVYDASLWELWYGERRQQMMRDLLKPGGRRKYPFCSTCPRRDRKLHENRIRTSP